MQLLFYIEENQSDRVAPEKRKALPPADCFLYKAISGRWKFMNNLTIFNNTEFGEIRTIMLEGNPYFVGEDVANILGVPKR